MKHNTATEIIDQSIESLSDALKDGHSETLERYLDLAASFHRYSFRNVAMIFSQFPDASIVAGYSAWKKRGRWVRPGEIGIAILAPIANRSAGNAHNDPSEADKIDTRTVAGFRLVHVFDVSQTEGEAVIALAPILGEPGYSLDVLMDVYKQLKIVVNFAQLPDSVNGYSLGGEVRISDRLDDTGAFRVLVHELAHELMHKESQYFRRDMKACVETEAEAVAFVVSKACGVNHLDRSADYIALHQGSSELLRNSLSRIHEASAKIIGMIEKTAGSGNRTHSTYNDQQPVHI